MSIIVAFMLVSASATAEQPSVAPAPAATAAPAKQAKEKKICKTDPESDPASHMVHRICHTQEEWNGQGMTQSTRSGFSVSGEKTEAH
jgi:hypothetical protein